MECLCWYGKRRACIVSLSLSLVSSFFLCHSLSHSYVSLSLFLSLSIILSLVSLPLSYCLLFLFLSHFVCLSYSIIVLSVTLSFFLESNHYSFSLSHIHTHTHTHLQSISNQSFYLYRSLSSLSIEYPKIHVDNDLVLLKNLKNNTCCWTLCRYATWRNWVDLFF